MQAQEETLKTYSFSQVEQLQKNNPKPIAIFVYADWCKICHGMKKTTFSNDKIIQLLNEKYYFINFNGEQKNEVYFLEKHFNYKPSGNSGTHELTNEIANVNGQISYPTFVLMNSKYEIDLQIASFINENKMYEIINKYLKISNKP